MDIIDVHGFNIILTAHVGLFGELSPFFHFVDSDDRLALECTTCRRELFAYPNPFLLQRECYAVLGELDDILEQEERVPMRVIFIQLESFIWSSMTSRRWEAVIPRMLLAIPSIIAQSVSRISPS